MLRTQAQLLAEVFGTADIPPAPRSMAHVICWSVDWLPAGVSHHNAELSLVQYPPMWFIDAFRTMICTGKNLWRSVVLEIPLFLIR